MSATWDDYKQTHRLRQEYYAPDAVTERRIDAQLAAEREQQIAAEAQLRLPPPKPRPNIFGNEGPAPDVFSVDPQSWEGKPAGEKAAAAGMQAVDIVAGAGAGLLRMAGSVVDLGAHVLGLESDLKDMVALINDKVPLPDLYKPQTMAGEVAGFAAQVGVPFAGSLKLLQAAGVSHAITRMVLAGGTAQGVGMFPGEENLGDALKGMRDIAPDTWVGLREALIDSLAKTDEELRALAAGPGGDPEAGVSEADYRDAYFDARLKNAAEGMLFEGLGEAVIGAVRTTYRVARTMQEHPNLAADMRNIAARAAEQMMSGPPAGSPSAQVGQIDPFLEIRQKRAAESVVAAYADASQTALEEADAVRRRVIAHEQLRTVLPPETRRAEGWSPEDAGKRYTTTSGGRFADLDLEQPTGAMDIDDDTLERLWEESIDFMDERGYDARAVVKKLRGTRGHDGAAVKPARPRDATFWQRLGELPQRARYWYEISAEGMRDRLPDLSDEEFELFTDVVGATSPSTPPTENFMRALGVLSHTLRNIPSDQDTIDPATVLRSLGSTNEGLKVGSFSGTFLHHLGLRDIPQLSTNDRQVAASFGMGPTDIGQNPVMYGVLSKFYQGLRDHLNSKLPPGAEPWQTWQLQAAGWVQQRIDTGNNDFEDYLSVMEMLGRKAQDAGIPTGPNGEITRATLMDPRLDPLMSTSIEDYRRRAKLNIQIAGSTQGYTQSRAMRREFELLGDVKAVEAWEGVERRALKSLAQKTTSPRLDEQGRQVYLPSGDAAKNEIPSPATKLALAVVIPGVKKDKIVTRTQVGSNEAGYASRLPLPSGASRQELETMLATFGAELNQGSVRAGRFRYLEEVPPEGPQPGQATSLLHSAPEPLTSKQVADFQAALGPDYQVDGHVTPVGYVLDVHPGPDGTPASIEQLDAARAAAGLSDRASSYVVAEYEGVNIQQGQYAQVISRWRADVVRDEAQGLVTAGVFDNMSDARAYIAGRMSEPEWTNQAKAKRADAARRRVAARFEEYKAARESVRAVRKQLDAEATAWAKEYAPRLQRARERAAREQRED